MPPWRLNYYKVALVRDEKFWDGSSWGHLLKMLQRLVQHWLLFHHRNSKGKWQEWVYILYHDKFSSVTRIYHEFYGGNTASPQLGEHGINGNCNPNTKKIWRKRFWPSNNMRLSRMKKVISTANNALKEEGATKNSVLAEFDSMMQEYGSLTMFMTKLVTLGLLTEQSAANQETQDYGCRGMLIT
jgi:hypothetical protein